MLFLLDRVGVAAAVGLIDRVLALVLGRDLVAPDADVLGQVLGRRRTLRRLRGSEPIRSLVRETSLDPGDFIFPLFVCEGEGVRREIGSMPGVFNLSVDEATSARLPSADQSKTTYE